VKQPAGAAVPRGGIQPQDGTGPLNGTDACPSAADIALLKQWDILQSGFRRFTDQLLADVEARAAVPPSSFQVLWFLLTVPGRTARMHELAQTLGFSTAGTTKVADRLADAGLIERCSSPADRRVILATLTGPGIEVATTAALALADALRARVVGPLGAGHLESLSAAVGSLDPHPASRVHGGVPVPASRLR
jgi:DNA-binding MarR family transcriptional regulator